jgi:hypothetical protein
MKTKNQPGNEIIRQARHQATLDLVVPFTTPDLTLSALNAANRLAHGLNAAIRLVRIQVVPYPLDLKRSPVLMDFLKEQLRSLASAMPARCEVRLAREFAAGLEGAIGEHSLVVLAMRRRPWRTRTERLAALLRAAGHTVVMVPKEEMKNNA